MAELTQDQLLVLSNLMYFKESTQNMSVKEMAVTLLSKADSYTNEPGGMKPADIKNLANAILTDPEYKVMHNLKAVDSINAGGNSLRATCFVDSKTGEATIAVRGTGGTVEAWSDNFMGGFQSDTDLQQRLSLFVEKQSYFYDNITITGHSKGGNLAQYATIVNGNAIDRCVSFDGQGFGDAFMDKYAAQIAANGSKISSVSARSDFVNVLLKPVPGSSRTYLGLNTRDGFADNHSPYLLWDYNRGNVDANGNYKPYTGFVDWAVSGVQKSVGDLINGLEVALRGVLSLFPNFTEARLYRLLGNLVGQILTDKNDFSDVQRQFNILIEELKTGINEFRGIYKLRDKLRDKYSGAILRYDKLEFESIAVPADLIKIYEIALYDIEARLSFVKVKGQDYSQPMKHLKELISRMKNHRKDMKALHDAMEEINYMYTSTEDIIKFRASHVQSW